MSHWHLLPVFDINGEPCLLLHVPQADPKLTRAIRKIGSDPLVQVERSLKAWSIAHELRDHAKDQLRAFDSAATWCESCDSGVPCSAWDEGKLSFEDFEPRIYEVTERDQWNKFVEETLDGFYAQGKAYAGDAACRAVGVRKGSEEGRVLREGVRLGVDFGERILNGLFGEQVREEKARRADAQGSAANSPRRSGMSLEEARSVLGVGPDATPQQIKRAFVGALYKAHPDRGGSDEAARKVVEARDALDTGTSS